MGLTYYLMVLPVRHFRVNRHLVAVESAFAEHLRMMRSRVGDNGYRLFIASPAMTAEVYEYRKQGFSMIDEETDLISFYTLFSDDAVHSVGDNVRCVYQAMRTVLSLVRRSSCVHSGLSWSAGLPFEFASILFGIVLRRRTVFVVDIDFRNSAYMSYKIGDWSWKSYVLCRYIYDTARSVQIQIAARWCSVVLLKGGKMAADFGAGRPNVHNFLDSSHCENNILDAESLEEKIQVIRDRSQPLQLTYFGRLTPYKGVDRCLRAVAMAHEAGANVRFDIVGGGEQLDALRNLATEYGANSYVRFLDSRPFDQQFFCLLYKYHLLLAAPLREDTPRSALDAMAAGVPYLAFNTYYYRELLQSGAGQTVPWPDVEAMTRAIIELEANREQIVRMVEHSVAFARANTQEVWLDRRFGWTFPPKAIR